MDQHSAPQGQKADDTTEYLKFVALLAVLLVAILILAGLSPRLIGRGATAVLGLDAATTGQPEQAVEEAPAVQPAEPVAPETVAEPESAVAPGATGGLDVEATGLQHEVLAGQTLFQIAELYGVSVQEIAAANNLVNPLQLDAGAILNIPQGR